MMFNKKHAIGCFSLVITMLVGMEAKAACPPHTSCDPAPPEEFIFVDVTGDSCSGIKAEDGGSATGTSIMIAGAAAADFDRDGYVDVFVSWDDTALYHNQGDGTFTRRQDVGIPASLGKITPGGLFFDYDNDGDLDLFLPERDLGFPTPPVDERLYRNETTGGVVSFSGVDNSSSGLDDAHLANGGLCAGDINNDGWVDLLVTRRGNYNLLYLNTDDGSGGRTFDDITVSAGLHVSANFFQCVMADFNDDGWIDIYQACDGCANRLWINDQDNTFTDRTADAGNPNGAYDMGVAVGDYDNDGDLDIYVTDIGVDAGAGGSGCWVGGGAHNWLHKNGGLDCTPSPCVPSLSDVSVAMGVDRGWWGWGATFMDADNDAFLDLAATNGWSDPPKNCADSSFFFLNKGDDPLTGFDEVGGAVGFDDTFWGSALIAFDYDRDGDLDLMQRGNNGDPLRLLRNDNCTSNNSLVIKPRRLSLNRLAIGAIVEVEPLNITPALPSGRDTLMRLISVGTSMFGQEPAEAFFGLGNATQVDITINWPNVAGTSSIDTTDINGLNISTCPILTVYKGVNAEADCNSNGRADGCDIGCGSGNTCGGVSGSADCNLNGVPDECDPDCDGDGIPNDCDPDCCVHADCGSGQLCCNYQCRTGECCDDPDCDPGDLCCNNVCESWECCDDPDCDPGDVCCDNVCESWECCDVSDCNLAEVCCSNECVECCDDSDCPLWAPFCRTSDHTCVMCLTNEDCPFGCCKPDGVCRSCGGGPGQ